MIYNQQIFNINMSLLLKKEELFEPIKKYWTSIGCKDIELYDETNKPFEYNPRVSAIHFEENAWGSSIKNPENLNNPDEIKRNYQTPVQCLERVPEDNIDNVLSSRGTIFIYKDNNPNAEISTLFGI